MIRTLPPELVEQSARAMFRARQIVTADWEEVCHDSPDIADEVRLLARHTIEAVLGYYSKPEHVTTRMMTAWLNTEGGPSHWFAAMIAAIGDHREPIT